MENRPRKTPAQFNRQEWRNKTSGNISQLKYTRELILKNYKNLKQPIFPQQSDLNDYILLHPSPPLLTAIFPFSHNLGEEVNSRKNLAREKRAEQMPEWYEEEEPKETTIKEKALNETAEKVLAKEEPLKEIKVVLTSKHVKNLDTGEYEEKELDDQFSKVDLKVEEKLKKEHFEDDYAEPEWDDPVEEEFEFKSIKPVKANVPVFDINLLRYHQAIRNPFIQILIDFGVMAGKTNMTFTPGSKPFEKIWYYKDLEKNVQGPFSTLEMFAWTIRDCFPPDLEISVGSPAFFVPMNIFNEFSQYEKEEPDTEAPAVISDPGFSLYGNKAEPPAEIPVPEPPEAERVEKIETKNQAMTLEQIEKAQMGLAGKTPDSSNSVIQKSFKTNESATFELKNILGLISKK